MTVAQALIETGLKPVEIAAKIGVSESTAARWMASKGSPRLKQYMALRREIPRFAELVDRKAA